MEKLIAGIHHFQNNIFASQRELFQRLADKQTPQALFITCSDSRINPNLVTQTEPGELFILRNAGNIIPPWGASNGGEQATIEFAVSLLNIRDIIVCGHSHCGAMKGLLDRESVKELPAVSAWLSHAEATRRIVLEKYRDHEGPAQLTLTAEENVLVQIENLRTHPSVAVGLASGRLNIHGWVYTIETGEVFAFDPDSEQFQPVAEAGLDIVTNRT